MSHELLYTSAPKGLKSGSRGFCTVMCTQGMPAPLMTALESLSAYRHIYPPGDHNASKNPVAWSHLKMMVAGRAYHVLSRIADFGLDYSQRGNKLAHHLAIEAPEQTTGGPAWLLEQSGTMQTDWDGHPRLLPAGRQLRAGSRPPSACKAWQVMTGDAGWAGALAESFLANPDRQVYIVFEPGMNLLPLVAEAIALLPSERRWDVTFSTYFTSLPPGVSCNWRCVLSGSPEAEQARKFGKALHIDLCQPVPPAIGSSLVLAARTGRTADKATRGSHIETANVEWTDDELASGLVPIANGGSENSDAGTGVQFADYAPAAGYGATRLSGMPPPPPPDRHRRTRSRLSASEAARRSKRIRWVVASVAVVMVTLSVALFAIPQTREWAQRQMNSRSDRSDAHAGENGAKKSKKARPSHERLKDGQLVAQKDSATAEEVPNQETEIESNTTDATVKEGEDSKIKNTRGRPGEDASHAGDREKAANTKPSKSVSEAAEHAKAGTQEPKAGDRPEAPASESQPSSETRQHPRLGERTLSAIPMTGVNHDNTYELFAISVQDAIEDEDKLWVPIRDATGEWKLHAPTGQSDIGCPSVDDSKKEVTISKEQGTGRVQVPVLAVQKSPDANAWSFLFVKRDEAWDVSKWCLMSVRTGDKLQLFALQEHDLKWKSRMFDGFSYTLPFAKLSEGAALPTLFISSVELRCTQSDESLRFENNTGAGDGESLTCRLSEAFAKKVLLSELDREFKLEVTRKDGRIKIKVSPFGSALNALFDKGMNLRITDILAQYSQNLAPNAKIVNPTRLATELGAARTEKSTVELSGWKSAIGAELENLVRDIKIAQSGSEPNKQQTIDRLKNRQESLAQTQKNLKSLENSRMAFLNFRDGLKAAQLVQLSLHYFFDITIQSSGSDRPVRRHVPVSLEFREENR